MKRNLRLGETRLNYAGSKMWIIEYVTSKNITVEFECGYIRKTNYTYFQKGAIRCPYDRNTFGKGYLGEGKYRTKTNNKLTPEYVLWVNVLRRSFSPSSKIRNPSYKDCCISDEWLNFQNFAEWYNNNFYKINNQRIELDKDILVKGNKIYSKSTCVFVPQNINTLFTKRKNERGEYPIGVTKRKGYDKFEVACNNGKGKPEYLGIYETIEEAFNAYKMYKERLIKKIADDYKDKIPDKLYKAMYKYEVEIDD